MASTMAIPFIPPGSHPMHPHANQLPRALKLRIPKSIPARAINPYRGTWVLAILRLLPSIIEITHNTILIKVRTSHIQTAPNANWRRYKIPHGMLEFSMRSIVMNVGFEKKNCWERAGRSIQVLPILHFSDKCGWLLGINRLSLRLSVDGLLANITHCCYPPITG